MKKIELFNKILGYLLLAFVIFSIGYAVGKEVGSRSSSIGEKVTRNENTTIFVYYLRSSYRCWQCNMIEVYTEELLNSEYSQQIESGLLEWQVVDYLKNREKALHYNISANTVIVSRYEDGQEVSYDRLDDVMRKVLNHDEFTDYVREAVIRQIQR